MMNKIRVTSPLRLLAGLLVGLPFALAYLALRAVIDLLELLSVVFEFAVERISEWVWNE